MAKGPALCSIEMYTLALSRVVDGTVFYHADLLFSSRVTLVLSAVQIQNIYMEENRSQNFLMITHM